MTISETIAKNLRSVYLGSNWVGANLKETIADISWEQATTQVNNCNSIATLIFHMTYYVRGITHALDHGELIIKDKWSFDHDPITNQDEWNQLVTSAYADVEIFCAKIEKLSNEDLEKDFLDGKYGTVYQNFSVVLEHCQYHLGQIVLLKKMLGS